MTLRSLIVPFLLALLILFPVSDSGMSDSATLGESDPLPPPKRPPRRPKAPWLAWMEKYDPEGLAKTRHLERESSRLYRKKQKDLRNTEPHNFAVVQKFERQNELAR